MLAEEGDEGFVDSALQAFDVGGVDEEFAAVGGEVSEVFYSGVISVVTQNLTHCAPVK